MLRSIFINLSRMKRAQRAITHWKFARRAASRFVAGETPADAIQAARGLNERKIWVSLDHLGENTTTPEDAEQSTTDILLILDEIGPGAILANVSIKLTQIGLLLDESLCKHNLTRILEKARSQNNFVRIDMEDSPFVDRTLAIYEWARQSAFDHLGVVIQAYLYRSETDIQRLMAISGRVRLCKGAYQESPRLAFPRKKDVDQNYDHLVELIMDEALKMSLSAAAGDGRTPPVLAIATHDPARIEHARSYAEMVHLPREFFEFQMLYGIRRDLQLQLVEQGYAMRVYVPYGTHWYPYFMRRLAERPANAWFFISNLMRR